MAEPSLNDPVHVPFDPLHAAFLSILPRIELHGRIYFRHLKAPDKKEDAIQEMIGLAWKWFVRLAQRGKDGTRFPSALASYAAKAVRSGRRVVGQEKAKDVFSSQAQQRHHFSVGKLPDFSTLSDTPLAEALHDNTQTPADEQVAFRLDFPAWLLTWDHRWRNMITDMAHGEKTQDLSSKYKVSQGRISQMRREFQIDLKRFIGELEQKKGMA